MGRGDERSIGNAPQQRRTVWKPKLTRTTPILLAVRSFRINVAQEALVDLRRRVAATRWPSRSWREGDGGHSHTGVDRRSGPRRISLFMTLS
ncbi:MAG: hypothetical protein E6J04_04085 [Chloroflexi bacterium]|nr:MAG: hypothetical protein E6J04_04085 [Chloroflexota bacterium]